MTTFTICFALQHLIFTKTGGRSQIIGI